MLPPDLPLPTDTFWLRCLDAVGVGVCLTDAQGRFVAVNQAYCALYHYHRDELLGQLFTMLLPEETRACALEGYRTTLTDFVGEPRLAHEFTVRRKDGRALEVLISRDLVRFGGEPFVVTTVLDISATKRASLTLRDTQAQLATILTHSQDAFMLFDRDLTLQSFNPVASRVAAHLYGCTLERGQSARELAAVAGGDLEHHLQTALQGHATTVIQPLTSASGQPVWTELHHQPIPDATGPDETGPDETGEVRGVILQSRDVTLRQQTEVRLERQVAFSRALNQLTEETLRAGPDDTQLYQRLLQRAVQVVPGAEAGSLLVRQEDGLFHYVATVGYDLAVLQAVTFHPWEMLNIDDAPVCYSEFAANKQLGDTRQEVLDSVGRVPDICVSLVVPIVLRGELMASFHLDSFTRRDAFDAEALEMGRGFASLVGSLLLRLALEHDLRTERASYAHQAQHDPLTGLPNRVLLAEQLSQAVVQGNSVAVMMLDLDDFKRVNDVHGHATGDALLQEVAERLRRAFRPGDTVARVSGDEFVVVSHITAHDGTRAAQQLAERTLQAFVAPLLSADIGVTPSIGISLYPQHGSTPESLLRAADRAMYCAKRGGKGYYYLAEA